MPKARAIEAPPAPGIGAPPGAPPWVTPELIEHTLRVWQPYYSDSLTPEDAVSILTSVSRLMGALSRS